MKDRKLTARQQAKFWSRVKVGGKMECWPWNGARMLRGYGVFYVGDEKTMLAHRVSFLIANGYLPKAVCHHCDNTSCVNPLHLFGGSQADNLNDMRRKGRHSEPPTFYGQEHPGSVLNDLKANEIRSMYAKGGISQARLAKIYGVCQSTIGNVVRGKHYRDTGQLNG